jgi:hypothetical protein
MIRRAGWVTTARLDRPQDPREAAAIPVAGTPNSRPRPHWRGISVCLSLIGLLTGCFGNTSPGAAASWDTQRSLAEQAMHTQDPAATLWDVTADLTQYRPFTLSTSDTTLDVEFKFVTTQAPTASPTISEGARVIRVELRDSAPTASLQLNPQMEFMDPAPTVAQRQERMREMSTVQIGPSEALQGTIAAGRAFVQQMHADAMLDIGLSHGKDTLLRAGLPQDQLESVSVAWSVLYIVANPARNLQILVDPRTGRALTHHEYTP